MRLLLLAVLVRSLLACDNGSHWNGTDCVLCAENHFCSNSTETPCAPNAHSLVGASACECDGGYTGDGVVCELTTQVLNTSAQDALNTTAPEALNTTAQDTLNTTAPDAVSTTAPEALNTTAEADQNTMEPESITTPDATTPACGPGFYGPNCTLCPSNSFCIDGLSFPCALNAVSDPGASTCVCDVGFWGDGTNCSSCTTCSANAILTTLCLRNSSSNMAICSCDAGYYGDGLTCTACKTCGPNATLTTTCPINSSSDIATCACDAGYYGDGTSCSSCTTCDPNAAPITPCAIGSTTDTVVCACKSGFYGNASNCTACPPNSSSPMGSVNQSQCLCITGFYKSILFDPTLLAYYPFDASNRLADVSLKTGPLTVTGSPTYTMDTSGPWINSDYANFDGSTSFMTLPNVNLGNIISTSGLSVCLWFSMTNCPTLPCKIWEAGETSTKNAIIINQASTGNINIQYRGGNTAFAGTVTPILTYGLWTHICVTVSTTQVWKVYIDGSQFGTDVTSVSLLTSGMSTYNYLGRGSGNYFLNGKIDEFRMYNTVLTASQVLSLKNLLPSTLSSSTSCTSCPLGAYSTSQGASSCSVCAAGTYQSQSASSTCFSCNTGTFSSATGSSTCISCFANSNTSGPGATSCTCSVGYRRLLPNRTLTRLIVGDSGVGLRYWDPVSQTCTVYPNTAGWGLPSKSLFMSLDQTIIYSQQWNGASAGNTLYVYNTTSQTSVTKTNLLANTQCLNIGPVSGKIYFALSGADYIRRTDTIDTMATNTIVSAQFQSTSATWGVLKLSQNETIAYYLYYVPSQTQSYIYKHNIATDSNPTPTQTLLAGAVGGTSTNTLETAGNLFSIGYQINNMDLSDDEMYLYIVPANGGSSTYIIRINTVFATVKAIKAVGSIYAFGNLLAGNILYYMGGYDKNIYRYNLSITETSPTVANTNMITCKTTGSNTGGMLGVFSATDAGCVACSQCSADAVSVQECDNTAVSDTVCACNSGYYGNGITCGSCIENASSAAGSSTCSCNAGYEGVATPTDPAFSGNLTAYYTFDPSDRAADSANVLGPATITNGEYTENCQWTRSNCVLFGTSRVSLPAINFPKTWSTCYWYRMSASGTNPGLLQFGSGTYIMSVNRFNADTWLTLYLQQGSNGYWKITDTITIGVWYHQCIVFDNSNFKIYNNGFMYLQMTWVFPSVSRAPNYIGYTDNWAKSWIGNIDEFRIYYSALTPAQVLSVFSFKTAKCYGCAVGTYFSNGNCVACYGNASTLSTASVNITSCVCNAGFIQIGQSCSICPRATFQNASVCQSCGNNTDTLALGRSSIADCFCKSGYYGNITNCILCEANSYCQNGTKISCPANSASSMGTGTCVCNPGYAETIVSGILVLCVPAPLGTYSPAGVLQYCDPNATTATTGNTQPSACFCNANFYGDGLVCYACDVNQTSPAGSTSPSQCACGAGFYTDYGAPRLYLGNQGVSMVSYNLLTGTCSRIKGAGSTAAATEAVTKGMALSNDGVWLYVATGTNIYEINTQNSTTNKYASTCQHLWMSPTNNLYCSMLGPSVAPVYRKRATESFATFTAVTTTTTGFATSLAFTMSKNESFVYQFRSSAGWHFLTRFRVGATVATTTNEAVCIDGTVFNAHYMEQSCFGANGLGSLGLSAGASSLVLSDNENFLYFFVTGNSIYNLFRVNILAKTWIFLKALTTNPSTSGVGLILVNNVLYVNLYLAKKLNFYNLSQSDPNPSTAISDSISYCDLALGTGPSGLVAASNPQCRRCTTCGALATQISPCTSTADTKCTCNTGYYGDGVVCTPCSTCSNFATTVSSCSATSNTQCACSAGYSGNGFTCTSCGGGTFAFPNSQICGSCPVNMTSAPGSTSFAACTCNAGFWGTPTSADPNLLPSNLVAYYTFNGNTPLKDYSGTQTDILSYGVTYASSGPWGGSGAAVFNGASYMQLPPMSFAMSASTGFSVCVWFNFGSASLNSRIFDFSSRGVDHNFFLARSGTSTSMMMGMIMYGTYRFTGTFDIPINLNTWYHGCVTNYQRTWNMFINGNLVSTATSTTDVIFLLFTQPWLGRSYQSDPMFQGSMAELRIYSKNLSLAEVRSIYNYQPTICSRCKVCSTFAVAEGECDVVADNIVCTCNAGYYGNGITCTPCPANSNTDGPGGTSITSCICLANFYRNTDNTCSACPSNSVSSPGATSVFDCTCVSSYYAQNLSVPLTTDASRLVYWLDQNTAIRTYSPVTGTCSTLANANVATNLGNCVTFGMATLFDWSKMYVICADSSKMLEYTFASSTSASITLPWATTRGMFISETNNVYIVLSDNRIMRKLVNESWSTWTAMTTTTSITSHDAFSLTVHRNESVAYNAANNVACSCIRIYKCVLSTTVPSCTPFVGHGASTSSSYTEIDGSLFRIGQQVLNINLDTDEKYLYVLPAAGGANPSFIIRINTVNALTVAIKNIANSYSFGNAIYNELIFWTRSSARTFSYYNLSQPDTTPSLSTNNIFTVAACASTSQPSGMHVPRLRYLTTRTCATCGSCSIYATQTQDCSIASDTSCVCNAGYWGTGKTCSECAVCSPYASSIPCTSTTNEQCSCWAGYYGDGVSCTVCPQGTWSSNGSAACSLCGANATTSAAGSTNISSCICIANYYTSGSKCVSCPGGSISPTASVSESQCICPENKFKLMSTGFSQGTIYFVDTGNSIQRYTSQTCSIVPNTNSASLNNAGIVLSMGLSSDATKLYVSYYNVATINIFDLTTNSFTSQTLSSALMYIWISRLNNIYYIFSASASTLRRKLSTEAWSISTPMSLATTVNPYSFTMTKDESIAYICEFTLYGYSVIYKNFLSTSSPSRTLLAGIVGAAYLSLTVSTAEIAGTSFALGYQLGSLVLSDDETYIYAQPAQGGSATYIIRINTINGLTRTIKSVGSAYAFSMILSGTILYWVGYTSKQLSFYDLSVFDANPLTATSGNTLCTGVGALNGLVGTSPASWTCATCKPCSPLATTVSPCNSTHDAVCFCNAGYFGDGSTCTICPFGTWSAANSLTCTQCPANSNTSAPGSTNASACVCKADYYGNGQAISTLDPRTNMIAFYAFDVNNRLADTANILGSLISNGNASYQRNEQFQLSDAAVFTGTNNFNIQSSFTLSSSFSILCWFKTTTTPNYQNIFSFSDTSGTNVLFLSYQPSNQLFLQHYTSGSYFSSPNIFTVLPNIWYHLCVTYNSGTFLLYINSVQQTSLQYTMPVVTRSKNTIGGGYINWRGAIDEFRMYNVVLNATQIAWISNLNNSFSGGCWSCPDGFWSNPGATSCRPHCPPGQYEDDGCHVCEIGHYCLKNKRTRCPTNLTAARGSSVCSPCPGPGTETNISLVMCGLMSCPLTPPVPLGPSTSGVGNLRIVNNTVTFFLNPYTDRPLSTLYIEFNFTRTSIMQVWVRGSGVFSFGVNDTRLYLSTINSDWSDIQVTFNASSVLMWFQGVSIFTTSQLEMRNPVVFEIDTWEPVSAMAIPTDSSNTIVLRDSIESDADFWPNETYELVFWANATPTISVEFNGTWYNASNRTFLAQASRGRMRIAGGVRISNPELVLRDRPCHACIIDQFCLNETAFPCPVNMHEAPNATYCICDNGYFGSPCELCWQNYYCINNAAIVCELGTKSLPGASVCVPCDVNEFCKDGYNSSCVANAQPLNWPNETVYNCTCNPGYYGALCVPCEPGYICNSGIRTACVPGTYNEGNLCKQCPMGQWSEPASTECGGCTAGSSIKVENNVASCVVCEAGFWASLGATECVACAPGKYNLSGSLTAESDCALCEPGYVCQGANHHAQCYAGTWSNKSGMANFSECNTCLEGTYCPGGATQYLCAAGTYSSALAATSGDTCANCSQGHWALSGASACVACLPGTYGVGGSLTSIDDCNLCDAGYVCSGMTSRVQCFAGTWSTGSGMSNLSQCAVCLAGTYCPGGTENYNCSPGTASTALAAPSVSTCLACAAGSWAYTGSSVCTACVPGMYALNASLTGPEFCSVCEPGYTCSGGSNRVLCPPGTWSTGEGVSSSCQVCLQAAYCTGGTNIGYCTTGTYSSALSASAPSACQLCAAGFWSGDVATACTACVPGKYALIGGLTNESQCLECDAGYTCSGANNRVPCAPGTYATESGLSNPTQCSTCPATAFCTGGTQVTYCAAGTFSTALQAPSVATCRGCAAGYWALAASSACTACAPGKYSLSTSLTSESQCIVCEAGFTCSGANNRFRCLAGTYSTGIGIANSTECAPCPVTAYCIGGAGLTYCAAGTFSTALQAATISTCKSCAAGTWALSGSSACTACAPGKYSLSSSLTNESQCLVCEAGYTCAGANNRVQCSPGTYSTGIGIANSTECAACPSTAYCSGGAQLVYCAAGTYSTAIRGSAPSICKSCTAGFWALAASSACTACAPGKYALGNSLTSESMCLVCEAGYTCAGANNRVQCSPGTYSTGIGIANSTECATCPITAYCTGGASLTYCAAGSFSSAVGATRSATCLACAPGSWAANASSACTDCVPGTYSLSGSLVSEQDCQLCEPGYRCTGANNHDYCAPGTWSNESGRFEPCNVCPITAYCTGGTHFVYCAASTFSNAVGATSAATCRLCALGSWSLTASSVCTPCSPGTYLLGRGIDPSDCLLCDTGYVCAGANNHDMCVPGTYSNNTGLYSQTQCYACLPGYYCTGGSSVTVCPLGSYSLATNVTSEINCPACPEGFYCPDPLTIIQCPVNTLSPPGSHDLVSCLCIPGYKCTFENVVHAEIVLPMTPEEFAAQQAEYIAAVAAAAGVDVSQITIVSVTTASGGGRRSGAWVEVHTSIRGAHKSRRALSALKSIDTYLKPYGLRAVTAKISIHHQVISSTKL